MKADMIPEVLPRVSCKPVLVVRFPYLGELVGSYTHTHTHTHTHISFHISLPRTIRTYPSEW